MMNPTIGLLFLCLATAAAVPPRMSRIVGGEETNIYEYPSMASMMFSWDWVDFWQYCGGTIISSRSILTAAHCAYRESPTRMRARVGATFANRGGVVHVVAQFIVSPDYDDDTLDNDIALMRTASTIWYSDLIKPASIPGIDYVVEPNEVVWAAGWGDTQSGGPPSDKLRHVQLWTISLEDCNARYGVINVTVNDNMLCAGVLDVGGRDQCQGDSGGPLYHNGVVVGVTSWGEGCADPRFPGVNALVSRHSIWIQSHS